MIVVGGNSAAEDALLLTGIAQKVILVHRRGTLRATGICHEPLQQAKNPEFCWNSTITQLLHGDNLTGVRLQNLRTGEENDLTCNAIFISVWHQPATELVAGQLERDSSEYIIADKTTRTNLPGVYAMGDVQTKPLRQVVTAVADGAVAVHAAEQYLAGGETT